MKARDMACPECGKEETAMTAKEGLTEHWHCHTCGLDFKQEFEIVFVRQTTGYRANPKNPDLEYDAYANGMVLYPEED